MSAQWSVGGKQEFKSKQNEILVGKYEVQREKIKPLISAYQTQS